MVKENHDAHVADQLSPSICPLCGNSNHCQNSSEGSELNCWCSSPDLEFPSGLLESIPDSAKGKSCICKSCVINYYKDHDIN